MIYLLVLMVTATWQLTHDIAAGPEDDSRMTADIADTHGIAAGPDDDSCDS